MAFPREFYIPKGAQKVEYKQVKIVVYLFNRNDKPHAMVFGGRRSKPDNYYSFNSEEERARKISLYINKVRSIQDKKKERRTAKKSVETSLVAGTILYASYDYNQTNVHFYQVIEILPSGKSVRIREIAQEKIATGFMCGDTLPVKNNFTGETMLKRTGSNDAIKINDSMRAVPWDGKVKYYSSYA